MTNTRNFTKACYSDFCAWEHEIICEFTDKQKESIKKAKGIIKDSNGEIFSIKFLWDDCISQEHADILYDQCAFDVVVIEVSTYGTTLTLQGKYDSRLQAEYLDETIEEEN